MRLRHSPQTNMSPGNRYVEGWDVFLRPWLDTTEHAADRRRRTTDNASSKRPQHVTAEGLTACWLTVLVLRASFC